jgi:hypothetical protein
MTVIITRCAKSLRLCALIFRIDTSRPYIASGINVLLGRGTGHLTRFVWLCHEWYPFLILYIQ